MCSNEVAMGLAVEPTSSWPSPAQDYYDGPVSLDRHLIRRPTSTFILRVTGSGLASAGILDGDELIVDRSVDAVLGQIIVVVHDQQHRVGRYAIAGGRACLITDTTSRPLTGQVQLWGVAVAAIHHLVARAP